MMSDTRKWWKRARKLGGHMRLFGLALALSALAYPAAAQTALTYPTRPITIIVTAPAGGTTDLVARAIADKLSASLKKPVVVDNRAGGNGIIAVNAVINGPDDGHTLLITHTAYSQNLALKPDNPPYDVAALKPVAQVFSSGSYLYISTALGVDTLADFVKLVRSKPKTYAYGSFGFGSTSHIFGEALNKAAGIDLVHIPYKGETTVLTDLLGGQIAAGWGSYGGVQPHAQSGKVKVLAISGTTRAPAAPEVKTFAEQGYPELNLNGWNGFLVRTSTSPEIVDKLSNEISKIAQSPEVKELVIGLGFVPVERKAPAFAEFLRNDIAQWTNTIKTLKIKIQE